MRHIMSVAVIGTAWLCLSACGQVDNTQAADAQAISAAAGYETVQNVTWVLVSLDQQEPVANSKVTLTLGPDGALYGTGGCNRYNGRYTLEGDHLKVNPAIVATMMACEESLMKQEYQYHQMLGTVVKWQMNAEQQLVLNTSGQHVLVFTKE